MRCSRSLYPIHSTAFRQHHWPTAVLKLVLILDAAPSGTTRVQFTVEFEQDGKEIEFYEFTIDPVVLSSE